MIFDANSAETYLASQTSWDDEPKLSDGEQSTLLTLAVNDAGQYTLDSLHAVIYLAWTWKLAKAVEYNEGDEKVIFDHIVKMLEYWRSRSVTPAGIYAGGISVADKRSRESDSDRVSSAFSTNMHETFVSLPTETRQS